MNGYIKRLFLRNFRKFEAIEISFSPFKNIILGRNGSGKTSVLEAIYLLNFGKSFRSRVVKEALMYGREKFYIGMEIFNRANLDKIELIFNGFEYLRKFNGKRAKVIDCVRNLFTVFLNSDVLYRVRRSHNERLRLIDRFVSGIDELYTFEYLKYNKIIRNIRKFKKKDDKNFSEISVWKKLFFKQSEILNNKRKAFLRDFNEFIHPLEILVEEVYIRGKKKNLVKFLDSRKSVDSNSSKGEFFFFLLNLFKRYADYISLKEEKGVVLAVDDFESFIDRERVKKFVSKEFNYQFIFTSIHWNEIRGINLIEI